MANNLKSKVKDQTGRGGMAYKPSGKTTNNDMRNAIAIPGSPEEAERQRRVWGNVQSAAKNTSQWEEQYNKSKAQKSMTNTRGTIAEAFRKRRNIRTTADSRSMTNNKTNKVR